MALKIGIEARIAPELVGGVGQVVIGLAAGLSALEDGEDEYRFYVFDDAKAWLAPYIGGPCRMATVRRPPLSGIKRNIKKRFPRLNAFLKKAI